MLSKMINENLFMTTIILFVIIYVIMNWMSIKNGVYITSNYINPLLYSLAIVLVLKILFSLCNCSSSVNDKIDVVDLKAYSIPNNVDLKGGQQYKLSNTKRNIFLKYE
jgi:hypothetical protein